VRRGRVLRDAAIAVGAFVVATVVAELLGATNLGTALTFGQIAFMAAIVGTILARARRGAPTGAGAGATAPDAPATPRPNAPPPPPRKRRR